MLRLQSALNIKRQQYDRLAAQIDKLKENAAKFGSSTVDVEMVRSNLKQLEKVYTKLDGERERLLAAHVAVSRWPEVRYVLPVRPPGAEPAAAEEARARAETPPIEYPDAKKWKELNARPQDSSGGDSRAWESSRQGLRGLPARGA